MALPQFQILSETELYTNALTPLQVVALSSDEYSSNYYLWDFGDGTTSTGLSSEHIYHKVGEFDVTLTQYLSSGEPVESDIQTVTTYNLIPNLMKWSDNSFEGGSIVASVKSETPFIIDVYNSWQQYDENSFIHLYVENSKSIPFDITDKRIHLKPNWRFLDDNDNVINNVTLNQKNIYAQKVDDEIYISTTQKTNSVFVGVSSTAEFYFVDDTPSGIDPSKDYLPSTIIATQDLSGVYGDSKFTGEDYLQYPSIIKSVFIDNIIPSGLSITSNGVFDIDYLKYQNTKIPYNIRLVDNNGNFIKTNPVESSITESYEMSIGFSGDVTIDPSKGFNGHTLERFVPDFSNLGGFFESHFIPTNTTSESVTLSASTKVDYTINKTLTRYGAFSDENSNRIYRVSYVQDFTQSHIRKNSEVIGNLVDGFTSNKFGIIVDPQYNITFLDSDDSRIEKYNTSFSLLENIELSSYSLSSSFASPSCIMLDSEGNEFITLYDSSKLLYRSDNTIEDVVLYSPVGESLKSPNCVDLLSDRDELYISFILSSNNFIEQYSYSTDPFSLTPLDSIDLSDDQCLDMVSNRDGGVLYTLESNEITNKSYIRLYDTTDNALLSSIDAGYKAEFITLDSNQTAWTVGVSILSSDIYDTLYTSDGDTYNLSSFSPVNYMRNIGGIAGDSYGNVWVIDSDNDRVIIFKTSDPTNYTEIIITEDQSNLKNKYIAYGDWNGFRWYNKFGEGSTVVTYELSGQSEPFVINPKNKYNLQKVNEDFDMTEMLKGYRTTEQMLNYENLFDNFLASIYGNKFDDGTYIGKNFYEKIANFVMNHADIDTCSIDALESFCQETGIEFEGKLDFPRDIKRLIDLFSIQFKKLWGDNYQTGFIEDYKGDELDIDTYILSANPQTKIIATEKFNDYNSILTPNVITSKIFPEPTTGFDGVEFSYPNVDYFKMDGVTGSGVFKRMEINGELWKSVDEYDGYYFYWEWDGFNLDWEFYKSNGNDVVVYWRVNNLDDLPNIINPLTPRGQYFWDTENLSFLEFEKQTSELMEGPPEFTYLGYTYPLSSYEQSWGWGLSVPSGGDLKNYYNFYELLPIEDQRLISVIDWNNELTSEELIELSSYSNYMNETGIVSTILGDKLRDGLGLYLS